MSKTYRILSTDEIDLLIRQGCSASDWSNVLVSHVFIPGNIRNVQFSGEVRIGDNSGEVVFDGGLKRNCGIYDACVHNCTIGNHVYIRHIFNYIANYDIEDHTIIENVELCLVDGETTFGNGIKVSYQISDS